MSSQEDLNSYRRLEDGEYKNQSTVDNVLQVARCFLPHCFKRSFTIKFL